MDSQRVLPAIQQALTLIHRNQKTQPTPETIKFVDLGCGDGKIVIFVTETFGFKGK